MLIHFIHQPLHLVLFRAAAKSPPLSVLSQPRQETPRVLHGFQLAVAQSVELATPGEEVPGSIPAVAVRSLLVGSVSV